MVSIKKIRCRWCGKEFTVPRTRQNNARKYCSTDCSRYAYLESHCAANRRYYKKYDNTESKKYLGNSISEHANPDYKIEMKIILKERKRLGL